MGAQRRRAGIWPWAVEKEWRLDLWRERNAAEVEGDDRWASRAATADERQTGRQIHERSPATGIAGVEVRSPRTVIGTLEP